MREKAHVTAKQIDTQHVASAAPTHKSEQTPAPHSPVERILHLQRTVGNQAVQRLVRSGALQAKLAISQPGDHYEQEADRVAEQVMRMPEPAMQAKPVSITPLVQRQVDEEEEDTLLQPKEVAGQTSDVSPNVETSINALRGGGQPLDPATRSYFEPRFGRDFSGVRVHTDAPVAEFAQAVNARAFTVGPDIAFGEGQYALGTNEGQQLLAHELTHVAQQENRSLKPLSIIKLNDPCESAEQKADTISISMTQNGPSLMSARQAKTAHKKKEKRRIVLPEAVVPGPVERITGGYIDEIVIRLLNHWHTQARFGIQNASLEGNDESCKWFLIALAGNLMWAATVFLPPTATIAIPLMSVAGAAIGSGSVERLLSQESPPSEDFRSKAVTSLGKKYQQIQQQRPLLTAYLRDKFYDKNLTDQADLIQSEEREKIAWKFMFMDNIGYNRPDQLEEVVKNEIEILWKHFLACWQEHNPFIYSDLPRELKQNLINFAPFCYDKALEESGIKSRIAATQEATIDLKSLLPKNPTVFLEEDTIPKP